MITKQQGVTLVELVIAMVIITIAVTAMSVLVRHLSTHVHVPATMLQASNLAHYYQQQITEQSASSFCALESRFKQPLCRHEKPGHHTLYPGKHLGDAYRDWTVELALSDSQYENVGQWTMKVYRSGSLAISSEFYQEIE